MRSSASKPVKEMTMEWDGKRKRQNNPAEGGFVRILPARRQFLEDGIPGESLSTSNTYLIDKAPP